MFWFLKQHHLRKNCLERWCQSKKKKQQKTLGWRLKKQSYYQCLSQAMVTHLSHQEMCSFNYWYWKILCLSETTNAWSSCQHIFLQLVMLRNLHISFYHRCAPFWHKCSRSIAVSSNSPASISLMLEFSHDTVFHSLIFLFQLPSLIYLVNTSSIQLCCYP